MSDVQHIRRTGQFLATVTDVVAVSPRMRRISLTGPGISEQRWPLACDIAVVLTGSDGREVRRRYTVRSAVAGTLVVDAVLHGHGPGSTWAASLQPGDELSFFGPRGEIALSPAPRLLALTDESGLPAIAALAESAGATGRGLQVLAEVPDETERYPLAGTAEVRWLYRGDRPAGQAAILLAGLSELRPTAEYAFVLGESRAIVALRDALADFGLGRADVYAKGYWNLNARSGR